MREDASGHSKDGEEDDDDRTAMCDRWKWRRLSDEAREEDQWGLRSIIPRAAYRKEQLVICKEGLGRWASKSDHRWKTCVVTDKVEQKSSCGDIEVGLLWETYIIC